MAGGEALTEPASGSGRLLCVRRNAADVFFFFYSSLYMHQSGPVSCLDGIVSDSKRRRGKSLQTYTVFIQIDIWFLLKRAFLENIFYGEKLWPSLLAFSAQREKKANHTGLLTASLSFIMQDFFLTL